MKTRLLHTSAIATALLVLPGIAAAQTSQSGQSRPAQQASGAGQCTDELAAFGRQMNEDGFWLSGYRRGAGWGSATYASGRTAATGTPAMPPGTAPNVGTGATAPAAPAAGGGTVADPFAGVQWSRAPDQALRTLYAAAHIFAENNDPEACRMVLNQTRQLYKSYTERLRQAGVEPSEVRGYRQRQLVLARPVTERERGVRADTITGTDVRNPQDEYLGSIEDVVFDPSSGEIAYVVIGRGGFLGIGEDYVAVPWKRLRVTPNLDTFVLNMREGQLESAPKVNPDVFATDEGYTRRRGEIDRFWESNRAG